VLETFNYDKSADISSEYATAWYNADTDWDGLPDGWERANFTNLNQDPNGDPDGDGLSNRQEWLGGTDPKVADAPALAAPLHSQTVFAGSDATFTVVPTGTVLSSYTFQWKFNGGDIVGATDQTLRINHAQFTNSGVYSVTIGNSGGTITTPLVRLTVWTPGAVRAWGLNDVNQCGMPTGFTNAVAVSAGISNSQALMIDGTMVGWGANYYGELSIPSTLSNVAAISAGGWHSMALKNDGTVVVWGDNSYGQKNVPSAVNGNAVAIAAGHNHCLALKNDGTVAVWGANDVNQWAVPGGLNNVVAIAAGGWHSLALKADGTVAAWGYNGQNRATVPGGLNNVIGIYAGQDFSAALKSDGTVQIWGNNTYTLTPPPSSVNHILQLSSGPWAQHLMAIRNDLALIPWGRNLEGQAAPPGDFGDVISVGGGQSHSVALYLSDWDGDGMPGWWERQYFGNLDQTGSGDYDGDGFSNLDEFLNGTDPTAASAPSIAVPPQSQTVLRGNDVIFTVMPAGSLTTGYTYQWCFNGRDIGGATDATLTLSQVQFTNSGVYNVRVGNSAGTITSLLARLTVWTPGAVGKFGDNTAHQCDVPAGLTNVVAISAGYSNSLALTIDGTVIPWGDLSHGATLPPGDATNVAAISSGAWHGMALRNDGTVLVWGRNNEGQTNVPSSINGNVVAIAAGSNHCLVLLKDGSTVAWGANDAYQGAGARGNSYVAIAAGALHNLALMANGTVVAWGSTVDDRTPAPGDLNNVVGVYAGQDYSAAIKSDGSVRVWGNNSYGQKTIPSDANQLLLLSSGSMAQHLVGIRNNLAVVPWGRSSEGQTSFPANMDDVISVAAGQAHTLALYMSDWDQDGLPGWWERQYFGNLDQTGSGDPDSDGLNNLDEFLGSSNPTAPNTPAIAVQPQSQTVFGGSDVTFSVTPTGSAAGSYTYQWQFNGRNISGATSRILNFSAVHFTNEGTYSVLIASVGGQVLSPLARLTVWTPGAVRAWGNNDANQTSVPANLTNVVAVSAGYSNSLALKIDGTLVAWGDLTHGATLPPADATNIVAISSGAWHSMGLRDDGTVLVWGRNNEQEFNIPSGVNGNAVAIAAGAYHCMALKRDRTVAVWGDNSSSQLNIPSGVNGNAVGIAAGAWHCLALKPYDAIVGWGNNGDSRATPPLELYNVIRIYAGQDFSAFLTGDGGVGAWGNSSFAQTPPPSTATQIVRLSSGPWAQHVLAIRNDLRIVPWGRNLEAQINVPVNLDDVVAVAAGQTHSLALYVPNTLGIAFPPQSQTVFAGNNATFTVGATGAVVNAYSYQWQYNGRPISGATDATLVIPNIQFTNSGVFNVIVTNGTHSVTSVLARLTVWTPGALRAWGDNMYGEGVEPTGLTNVVSISCGNGYNTVLKIDGTVFPWGDSSFSKTTVPSSATNIAVLAGGSQHTLGLRNDGTVVAWGWNSGGSTTVPTDLHDVVAIAGGYYFSMALQNDGTIRVWGTTTEGEASIPSAVNGRAVAIAAGNNHCLALRDDGQVFTWGQNFDQSTVPTDLGQVVGIAGFVNGCAALKADGTVRVWGGGSSAPPPSATDIIQLSSSSDAIHYLAIRKDLRVIPWGANGSGQINLPSQLGDVTAIATGQNHSLALYVSDWDGDGMPGWWERLYFGNLERDGTGDYDGDGVSDLQEFLSGSNPTTYSPARLASWRFNRSDCIGDQGQVPLTCAGLSAALVPGLEGAAIDMNDKGQGFPTKILSYRCVEANSQANINLTGGTVRFWFKPSWNSVSQGGFGLGSAGRLINIGEYSSPPTIGCWQLVLASSGDAIKFAVSDNSGNPSHLIETSYLTIPGGIVMNQWYQIAVTYTPTSLAIYVNGTALTPAPSGGLNSIVPPQSIRDLGFFIGSDPGGSQKSWGAFEFLETFNYAKTATQIASEYTDTDGDGVPNSQDSDFTDPTKGFLNITIDKPLNGSTINR
jgi:alpha-tubulin suppressor-like RCC1 family protein